MKEKQTPQTYNRVKIKGYVGSLMNYVVETQFMDEKLWTLLSNQFKLHSDIDGDWRGEFWGKTMRGACLTYKSCPSKKLYDILKKTVLDMISYQDKDGNLSAYPKEKEFSGWDMWGRKYAILGLLSFADISRSESLRNKVIKAASKAADYITKHVGSGRGKKGIFETSNLYGSMNSASILKVFTKLYGETGKKKYLDFATYLVDSGLCKGFNLVEAALDDSLSPYQYAVKKAYEEMSCIEGLVEYYKLTDEEKCLKAAIYFTDKLLESDFTIIGCSGCDGEFFDNSSKSQTARKNGIMQETCVTVTLMGLFSSLFEVTGDHKYMDAFERSTLNAFAGSVNNERQSMASAKGNVWTLEGCTQAPHGSFPFDSYSPLWHGKRATQVGGFKVMQDGDTYGCCACNGGRGIGLIGMFAITKGEGGFAINGYYDENASFEIEGETIDVSVKANLYVSDKVVIKIKGEGKRVSASFRIPSWSIKTDVYLDGELVASPKEGYFTLNHAFKENVVEIRFRSAVKANVIGDMVAFTKGPVVLSLDHRISSDEPVLLPKSGKVRAKRIKNEAFASNVCYEIGCGEQKVKVVDYAQAGKDSDNDESWVSVWQPLK